MFTPYWSGILIENHYKQFISKLSDESKFKITIKDFKRGYVTSNVSIDRYNVGRKD
jgi:hypothetical protein